MKLVSAALALCLVGCFSSQSALAQRGGNIRPIQNLAADCNSADAGDSCETARTWCVNYTEGVILACNPTTKVYDAVGSASEGGGSLDSDLTVIAGLSCSSGQPIEWNGSAWACGTDDSSSGVVSDGDKGDISVTLSGTAWGIDSGVVALGDLANIATNTLIGRDATGSGAPAAITLTGGLEFSGSDSIQIAAGGVTTAKIDDGDVTFSKLQTVTANKMLGSIAGGTVEEISVTSAGRAILDDAAASDQRTTLGLGTMSTQAADAVAVTGGAIGGISVGDVDAWTGSYVPAPFSAAGMDTDTDGTQEWNCSSNTCYADPNDDGDPDVEITATGMSWTGTAPSFPGIAAPTDSDIYVRAGGDANVVVLNADRTDDDGGWYFADTATGFHGIFEDDTFSANRTFTFPNTSGDVVLAASSNTLTNKTYDAGGTGNVFTLEDAASPSASSAGQMKLDTTAQQIIYNGSAARVIDPRQALSLVIPSPTSSDDYIFFKAPYGMTITSIACITGAATSASIDIQECTSAGASCTTVDAAITCDADGAADDGSLSNASIDAGDWIKVESGTVTGSVLFTSITVNYLVVQE